MNYMDNHSKYNNTSFIIIIIDVHNFRSIFSSHQLKIFWTCSILDEYKKKIPEEEWIKDDVPSSSTTEWSILSITHAYAFFLVSISNELKIELFRSFTLSRLVKLMRLRELHICVCLCPLSLFSFCLAHIFFSLFVHLYNGMSMHHQFLFVLSYTHIRTKNKDNNYRYITKEKLYSSIINYISY